MRTWNGSPQRELTTNPLSGKLGADHWSCPARSPTAPPAASAPDATATPTPRNCTAPTRPGPAKSAAGPSPGPSPPKTPNGSAPTSTPTATCASSSPNSKPSPSSSPGSPGPCTHSHPPSREISPLNAGSAHPKPAKTTGQRVLSLAHCGLPTELPVWYRQNCFGDLIFSVARESDSGSCCRAVLFSGAGGWVQGVLAALEGGCPVGEDDQWWRWVLRGCQPSGW